MHRIATSILHIFCEEDSSSRRTVSVPCYETCDECRTEQWDISLINNTPQSDCGSGSEFESTKLYCQHSGVCVYIMDINKLNISSASSNSWCCMSADGFATIKEQLLKVDDKITLILFILTNNSLDREGRDGIEKAIKYFGQSTSYPTALAITGCEQLTEDARRERIEEFKSNSETREFAQCINIDNGIVAVGFPDMTTVRKELKPSFSEEILKSQIKLEKIINSAEAVKYYDGPGSKLEKRGTSHSCTCTCF